MKVRNLGEPFQKSKEESIKQARARLREYMDDTFVEFLDVNVLSAKDVYEVIMESAKAQHEYYNKQEGINYEFIQLLKGEP